MSRLLAFSGSARAASLNQRLVTIAAARARDAGAEVTLVNLGEFDLPLYDGDLEERDGQPEGATRLQALMQEHDGFLIACPEYNGSITPLLKNAIDWASRPADGVPMLGAFRGKTALLLAASPGALGGLRGLVHVRAILAGIGVHVHPDQLAVGAAMKTLTDDGRIADDKLDGLLGTMVTGFCAHTDAVVGQVGSKA